MKKIALLFPMLLLPLLAGAQKSKVDQLFDKYYGRDGFTSVLVSEGAFKVISEDNQAEGDFDSPMKKIKRVRVIAQDDESEKKVEVNFMDELKGMKFNAYEELVFVKEADQEVRVLAREEAGKLAELLVIVSGEDNVLVSVEGRFTMEDLEALGALEGLDSLDKIL